MSFFSDWHAPSFFVFSGIGASAAAIGAALGTPLPIAGAQAGVLVVGAAFAAYLAGRSSSAATNRWGAAATELGLDMNASTEEIIASLTTGGGEPEGQVEMFASLPVPVVVADGAGQVMFQNDAFGRFLEEVGSSADDLFAAAGSGLKDEGQVAFASGEHMLSASSAPIGSDGLSVSIWEDMTGQEDGKAALGSIRETGLVVLWSPDGAFKSGNSGLETAKIDPAKRVTDQCCLADGTPLSWAGIRSGKPFSAMLEWGKAGAILDAAFVPVKGKDGSVMHILMFAKDVTADYDRYRRAEEFMQCVDRTSATIEFEPDGTIVTANEAFLATMGYSLDQIVGQHHRMFADAAYTSSAEYAQFWAELGRGETKHGLFKRLTATGQEVYILGAYASITNRNGEVTRVVKYVTDVTEQEVSRLREQEELDRTRKLQGELVSVLRGALAAVADRDLDCSINQPYPPGYEEICENFNNAVVALATALTEVKSASRQIDSNAGAISGAANELASRTEAQAATLEQSAASLDELTASMRSASDRTTEIEGQVKDAKNNAETGGVVVKDAVTAMSEIEQSSAQIAQIIGVIDDIAFQTNLLALNAGVEAARAGDAGRGFAVVASEVRALAQRSSEAAKEIKTHIAQSTEHVSRGVDLVGRTGSALTGIVESFDEIERLITEVASSSRDQASGVSEINVAIGQLDRATQENAAMVEETTAAGSSLTGDAQLLSDLVGRFKLADSGVKAFSAPRPMETAKPAPARQAQTIAVGNTALKLDDQDWEEF